MHGRNNHVPFATDWAGGPRTDCSLRLEKGCVDVYTKSEPNAAGQSVDLLKEWQIDFGP